MTKLEAVYRGKVALITGAASGLGEALARTLHACGAELWLADINREKLDSLHDALRDARVRFCALDVTQSQAFAALVERIASESGRLDVIINNAGLGITGECQLMAIEDWQQVRSVNLDGVINGSLAAYRLMVKQRSGQIINVASLAALFPYPLHTVYAATKHAVFGFTTALRLEAREHGVRVSVVCPGPVDTPIFETTRLIGLDRERAMQIFNYRRLKPAQAAEALLAAASRDVGVIIFPWPYRWFWRALRWVPWLVEPALRKMVRDLRNCRESPTAP